MCTVTYIPSKGGCYLTSSRDEHFLRPAAITPGVYCHNETNIVYPRDAKANGTWIAFTQNGNAAVLLNGAFNKHVPKPPYRKSRGLVFLDIISATQPEQYFPGTDLQNIEPFTLVLFVNGRLFEARWDGRQKHFLQLDETATYIWSSCTLYTPEIIAERKKWFTDWLAQTPQPSAADIFNFHHFAGNGDCRNSICMNRENEMLTVSITGIDMQMEAATMHYADLQQNKHFLKTLALDAVTV